MKKPARMRRRFKQLPLFPEPLRSAQKRSGGPVHIVDPSSSARTVCGVAIAYGPTWSGGAPNGKACRSCQRMQSSAEELAARLTTTATTKKKGARR